MIIAFIDESGKPTFREKNYKTNEPLPFVVSTVIVPNDQTLNDIRKNLTNIKLKFNLDPNLEIHASDLFHPKKDNPYSNWPTDQINDFATELSLIIKNLDISIISVAIIKKCSYANIADKQLKISVLESAYSLLFERIVKFAERNKNNEWIILVHDQINARSDSEMTEEEQSVINIINNTISNNFYIKGLSATFRIFQPVYFSNSRLDPLQLADFVSYVVRRHLIESVDVKFLYKKFFDNISEKFDKGPREQLEGWGLKTWIIYGKC